MDLQTLLGMIFTFVMAIVVVRTLAEVLSRFLRLKERQLELRESAGGSSAAAEYAAKAERLERRVQVLERLATDRGQDLARSIEDLRAEKEPVK
jgi:ABC-type phosphate transport system auxiliary subunit